MNILSLLNPYIDLDYKRFHQKICQTNYEILGIKIPILRNIAKGLLKKYEYNEILNNLDNKYYECVMLEALVIGNAKISYEEKLKLIDEFLPKIDNWAICDIFCAELKFIKKHQKEFLTFINKKLKSKEEYSIRFGIVCLLDYYINDEYIDNTLKKMLEINNDKYYVKMAISWLYSICLIKYFDKTINFLNNNKDNIDKWVFNKSLQKAIESYRICKEDKDILKNMKIK